MKFIRICVYIGMVAALMFVIFNSVRAGRSYLEIHTALQNRIESYFEDMRFSRLLRQAHFEYLRATGRNHFNNVTFLTDGRMIIDNLAPNFFLNERADGIIELGNFVERSGAHFIFVRTPNKLQDYSTLPLAFTHNQSIEYGDSLIRLISEAGINTFDFRVKMNEEGIDIAEAFFLRDIHFTPETSLWMTGVLGAYINEKFGLGIDVSVWESERFERRTFEQAFQGNEIRYVHGYHIFEDVTVVFPKFHTDLAVSSITYFSYQQGRAGSFTDAFMPRVHEENVERFDFADINIPEYPFTRIVNNAASNNKTVLLISESNGLLQSTHLSLGFAGLDFLYLVTGFTDRVIWEFIADGDYDVVIFAVSDAALSFDDAYTFYLDRLFLGHPPS